MAAIQFSIDDDHPLALELASLQGAVERYQHEAHGASVKLQRHALETSQTLDRFHSLELENARLRAEVDVLRAHPDTTPDPMSHQVQELTLALRRLSDKLTLTEEALRDRTHELIDARSDLEAAKAASGTAHALAQHTTAQLDEAKARARELERKARAAEEERKMADLVVQEYADLVRTLEGRGKPSTPGSVNSVSDSEKTGSSVTLVDSLAEGRSGLQKLLEEFNGENERLGREIDKLHADLELKTSELSAERKRSEHDRAMLAECQSQLAGYEANDTTAAKMVSRYMKFSQASTDALQKAMENMRVRHATTAATLEAETVQLQKTLVAERRHAEKLRDALDELAEDLSREAYGRRRETALRLAFLSREEGLAESLRRWMRRGKEAVERALPSPVLPDSPAATFRDTFHRIIKDAEGLLDILNGQPAHEDNLLAAVARLAAAQHAVASLTRELHLETEKRLSLARKLGEVYTDDIQPVSVRAPSKPRRSPVRRIGATARSPSPASKSSQPSEGPVDSPVDTDQAQHVAAPDSTVHIDTVSVDTRTQPSDTPPEVNGSAAHVPDVKAAGGSLKHEDASTIIRPFVQANGYTNASPPQCALGAGSAAVALPASESLHTGTSDALITIVSPPSPLISDVHNVAHSAPAAISAMVDTSDGPPPSVITADSLLDHDPSSSDIPPTLDHASDNSVSQAILQQPPSTIAETNGTAFKDDTPPIDTHVLTTPALPVAASPFASPAQTTSQDVSSISPFPLLEDLEKVKHRYDDMQRAFRDCHLALKELRRDVSDLPQTSELSIVVQRAAERLNDLNEDTRVELEIRIADEERLAAGYMTLLSVPGALGADEEDGEDNASLAASMCAFVDGSDATVTRAVQQLSRKLSDLQHDIAALKRTAYDLLSSAEDAPTTPTKASSGWSWTTGLLTPTRAASPAPQSFGSVVTSSRLRHSSSLSHMKRTSSESSTDGQDPFVSLGLRTPMPALVLSPPRATPTPRAASAMYMLGLGGRGPQLNLGTASPARSAPKPPPAVAEQEVTDTETEDEDEDDLDTDVE